jgi:hypothetical protein
MTTSFTIEDIRRSIPGDYVNRGREYLMQGRVSRFGHPDSNHYQALVQGSRAKPYDVDVRMVHGRTGKQIYGLCSCPMRVNCKHVAAVLLRALQGPPDVRRTRIRNCTSLPAATPGHRMRAPRSCPASSATGWSVRAGPWRRHQRGTSTRPRSSIACSMCSSRRMSKRGALPRCSS